MVSLVNLMYYLAAMSYVILVHILYLIAFIYGFNLLEISYIVSVKENLKSFTAKIMDILVSSSSYILALIDILILFFCHVINYISFLIKAKLLFYLILVELQIFADITQLSSDLKSLEKLVSNLRSEIDKYIEKLEQVKKLLKELAKVIKDDEKLIKRINKLKTGKNINTFNHKFYNISQKISKMANVLSSSKLEKFIKSRSVNNAQIVNSLKMDLVKLMKHLSSIKNMSFDSSKIKEVQQALVYIKKILRRVQTNDINYLIASAEIISIIENLIELEEIKLLKINLQILQIQNLYLNLLIRGYLLIITIEFYQEIEPKMSGLCNSLKFDCSQVGEFLKSCCEVEQNALNISNTIGECIKKLGQVCKSQKHCGAPKYLVDLYVTFIKVILNLKFYVDLMVREMLIFKMIIFNLIVMALSSVFIEFIESQITQIRNVDSRGGVIKTYNRNRHKNKGNNILFAIIKLLH